MKLIRYDKSHYKTIKRIYQEGIDTKNATAETSAPSWEDFDKKFSKDIRIALVQKEEILGWASVSKVSERKAYEGVVEVTVYVDVPYHRKGYGERLLQKLINCCEQ